MFEFENRRIFDAIGREAGCKRLAQEFYRRVAVTPELKRLFPGKSLRCASEELSAFLVQLFDGDPKQTQYRWWLSLRESHARFEISLDERDVWLRLMSETLESLVQDSDVVAAFRQFFGVGASYVVRENAPRVEHPELRLGWERQLALDELVTFLAQGKYDQAIAIANTFVASPSTLLGILAKMLKARHKPLDDFVLCNITVEILYVRYNGRTLLHIAAGLGCGPVVRELLRLGVDPNVLDNGQHSALYRASGCPRESDARAVVLELVAAGAKVDLAGGISRATAMHEAARHGSIAVLRALLESGANLRLKDKRGSTPLERAIRCRRSEAAALLQSWPIE